MSRIRQIYRVFSFLGLVLIGTGCAAVPGLDDPAEPLEEARSAPATEQTADPRSAAPTDEEPSRDYAAAAGREGGETGLDEGKSSYGPEDLAESQEGDRILAVVDGQEIRSSSLYQIYFMDNPMKMRDILENLILYILVQREAARLGIRASGDEVEGTLGRLLKEQQNMIQLKIDERLTLEDFVRKNYNMDMASYRKRIRRLAVFQVLMEHCVRYTELQVRRLRIGVIMVKELAKAGELQKKLQKGANFETLAKENSIDPSRAIGGILPPLPADMDYPVVKDALKLGVGEVSEVEETVISDQTLYRIVKLVEILEPIRGTYGELATQVRANLDAQPMLFPDVIRYWRDSLEERYDLEYRVP